MKAAIFTLGGVAASLLPPIAILTSGPVIGEQTTLPRAQPVNKLLGIPYAEAERFAPPTPPRPWLLPRNTTAFRPACTQFIGSYPGRSLPLTHDRADQLGLTPEPEIYEDVFAALVPESEDCLYLNAFAPATPGPPGGRPVILFIHGGGWQLSHGRIDLSGFAGYEDVVAFSFNYRTNSEFSPPE